MIRFLKYFALISFGFLWYLGFPNPIGKWLSEHKIVKDDYRYGDLYRMSNLAEFKAPIEVCSPKENTKTTNTSLIIMGDSFTEKERIDKSNFNGLSTYQRFFITDTIRTKLDKSKKNILIIETVERHFRERFIKPYTNLQLSDNEDVIAKIDGRSLLQRIVKGHIPYNTERHESVLFSSDFFFKIKEWKAWINQKVFNRVDDNVVLSKDGKNILYQVDAQSSGITSSFDVVSEEEINAIVENLNFTYAYYKKVGFDEVYLTIAPNKTSILGTDLGVYNHLIERVQQNANLKMPFFDVYTPFKKSKKILFGVGDTHWNCEGKQIWLDEVNEKL